MPISVDISSNVTGTPSFKYAVRVRDEVFAKQGNAVRLVPNATMTLKDATGATAIIYSDENFTVANTAGAVTTDNDGVWQAFLDPAKGPFTPVYKTVSYKPIPVYPDARESEYDLAKFATDHGIALGDVVASRTWVEDRLADFVPGTAAGLTEAQVKAIVDAEIAKIPQGQPGSTPDLSPFARVRGDETSKDIIIKTTAPSGTVTADWVAANAFVKDGKAWFKEAAVSQAPNTGNVTPPATSTVGERLAVSDAHFKATYLVDGKLSGATITIRALSRTLEELVLTQDFTTFDKVLAWADANMMRTAQTTAKKLYGSTYTLSSNTMTTATVDSGAMLSISAGALVRAWNATNLQKYADRASEILSDLVNFCVVKDEGRAYLAIDETQKQAGGQGHHTDPGNGGYVTMHEPGVVSPLYLRAAKTFTGNTIFDELLSGRYDLLTKMTSRTGTSLPSDVISYNAATHQVGIVANGVAGWTIDRSSDFGLSAQRGMQNVIDDKVLYPNENRGTTAIARVAAHYAGKAASGKILDVYTSEGVDVGTAESVESTLYAIRSLKDNNAGAAATLRTAKIPDDTAVDGDGRFLANQVKGATAVTTRDQDLLAWRAYARDNGLFTDITKLGSNPSVGVISAPDGTQTTTPPVVITPPTTTPGTTPGGGTAPTTPTGAVTLYADKNQYRFLALGWALGLPNGTTNEKTWKARALNFAGQASGQWIGDWDEQANGTKIYIDDAAAAGAVAQVLSYRIPGRDLGQYSAGGAANRAAYETYINNLAAAINTRRVVLCYEPDSLPHMADMNTADRDGRASTMKWGIQTLRSKCPNLYIYVDAGHSNWLTVAKTVELLRLVGIENANGIATNVSNFRPDAEIVRWSQDVIRALNIPKLGFVYDSGRNGNNTPPQDGDFPAGDGQRFANPRGRQIGQLPQFGGAGLPELCHGRIWWKRQGESDGNNGDGAPPAGQFFPLQLLNTAVGDNVYGNSNYNSSGYLQRAPYSFNGGSNAGSGT